VISFDMGGTSTDVCRIENGRPEVAYERVIDGQTVRMPSVAVHTVGAGGGSLGWVDAGGALRVGPRSAGAAPGPACYGRGGMEPAITDAHLALGRLGTTLAGSLRLDRGAAVAALGRLGTAAGLDGGETAAGMIEVVQATMERAIRAVSVEEGADPRRAVLVAFGGAGGLHATALARRLEMRAVVVPPHAGVFSALGLVLAPPRQDVRRSVLLGEEEASRLDQALAEVAATAGRLLSGSIGAAPVRVETVVDVRYRGQAYETPVVHEPGAGWDVLAARFHTAHRRRNGFDRTGDPIEAVTVRAVAVGTPALSWNDLPDHVPTGDPAAGSRPVRVGGEELEMEVWWRPGLAPGAEVRGPAAVEDLDSTTWIAPGEQAVVHPTGALVVSW
jgi:N-methylhydantoinase A